MAKETRKMSRNARLVEIGDICDKIEERWANQAPDDSRFHTVTDKELRRMQKLARKLP